MASHVFARSLSVFSVLVLLLPCTAFVSSAGADIINVPEDYPTIQEAINFSSKGDEIVVAPGVYPEQINFFGQAITLRSEQGPNVTTIDGGGGDVVTCASGEGLDTVLQGFAITGGGSGVNNFNASSPTITDCIFFQNSRGVLAADNGSASVVSRCLFLENGGNTDQGAAIRVGGGTLVASECIFVGNEAGSSGGAIGAGGASVSIHDCIFRGNSSGNAGGGGVHLNSCVGEIENCVFAENSTSGKGGGLYHGNIGDLIVTNCLFSSNYAGLFGGGLYSGGLTGHVVFVTNSTFISNEADTGGGVWGGWPLITNSVLWLNTPNQIVGPTTEVAYCDVLGGWDGLGKGNINAYPMFADMDGGNLRLLEGSPCIDTGSNDYVPGDLIVDLDGNDRTVDGDGNGTAVVDMGAYEYQGHPVCAEDLNGDGTVGPFDLATLLGSWGFNPGHPADFNLDGQIGPFDLAVLLGAWGVC